MKRPLGALLLLSLALVLTVAFIKDADAEETSVVPDISMVNSIQRGNSLTVTINNAELFSFNYNQFFVYKDGGLLGFPFLDNGTAVMPAYWFDPGEYTFRFEGTVLETQESFNITRVLTVTGDPGVEGPSITADHDSADINETIRFTISMPGAEEIAYRYITIKNGTQWSTWNLYSQQTDTDEVTIETISSEGDCTLVCYAKALVDGQWTAFSAYEVPINPAPTLDRVAFELPIIQRAGEPVTLTFKQIEHAEQYWVSLYKNNSFIKSFTYTEAGDHILDYEFEPGSYSVSVNASAEGYASSYGSRKYFDIVSELLEGPSLVINEKKEYATYTMVTITATRAGATRFRYSRYDYLNEELTDTNWSIQYYDADNGSATDTIYVSGFDEGDLIAKLYWQAFVNGTWTDVATESITVKKPKRLATPVLTVPEGSIEAGSPVTITLGEVENADHYRILADLDGNYYEINNSWAQAGENEMPALTIPGTYTIRASAQPEHWDDPIGESREAIATITVTGNAANGPDLSVEKTGTEATVTALMNGAEKFYLTTAVLFENGNIYNRCAWYGSINANDGLGQYDMTLWDNYLGKTYVANVSAFINGKWTEPTEIRFIHDGTSDHSLLDPDFTLPEDLTIIEASAFEGIMASAVYVPNACTSIGAGAFADSAIQQIRLPQNCQIDPTAFDGCENLMIIIVPSGGTSQTWAESYTSSHSDCVIITE